MSRFGWTGVDLFFVLSGYLIASQLFATIIKGESISFKTFFLKRFFRIVPAYLLVVAIYFLFPSSHEREALAPLWKYLSFTQNLGLDLRTQGTFSHAWSLCIEEQFYLLLPLLLIAVVRFKIIKKAAWLLFVLFAAGVAVRWWMFVSKAATPPDGEIDIINWYKWIYYPTYCRLDGLITGVGIAALFRFRPAIKEKMAGYGNIIFLLSLLVLTAAYFICLDEYAFIASVAGFPLVSAGYGLMVVSALCPGSFLYKFKWGVTAKIAALSYALYLSHKIIIHITQQQLSGSHISADSGWMLLISVITCLAGALLINQLIEQPFLRFRDKILMKTPTTAKNTNNK